MVIILNGILVCYSLRDAKSNARYYHFHHRERERTTIYSSTNITLTYPEILNS